MATIKEIAEEAGDQYDYRFQCDSWERREKCQRIRGKRSRKRWYVTTMLPITERRKRRRS